ncbi:hypothetical protein Goari_002700 [Gossypium aridum]|uniref:Uncharacterized protein n=1 Tax=Gossypium aridum TaxID=34290 RepID=A0A7J8Y994_GOSAI|nr:hypothetical protein [Gossypium aridum]
MIDMHLRYSGGDLHGVTAKIVDMPHHYVEIHPNIRKQFWDPQHWPKHVLVRYTWSVCLLLKSLFHMHIVCLVLNLVCLQVFSSVGVYTLKPILSFKAKETRVSKTRFDSKKYSNFEEEQSEIDVTSGFYVLFGSACVENFSPYRKVHINVVNGTSCTLGARALVLPQVQGRKQCSPE